MQNSERIVYVDFLGVMRIQTEYGEICESEINSAPVCKLIAYLVLNRKSIISADVLSAIIWPQGVEDPYSSLRGLVFRTKKLLKNAFPDLSFIKAKNGSYAINEDFYLVVDTELLSDRINAMTVHKILSERDIESDLNFLDSHCYAFMESLSSDIWGMPVGTFFNSKLLSYILEVTDTLFREKRFDEVILYATKGLSVDPLSENLHKKIILALLQQGHRKLASDHYNNIIKVFEKDYNITPSNSFLDLADAIANPDKNSI